MPNQKEIMKRVEEIDANKSNMTDAEYMEQMEQLRNEWRAEASESESEEEDEFGEDYTISPDRTETIKLIRKVDTRLFINLKYKDNQRDFYSLAFQNINEPEKLISTRLSPSEYDEISKIISTQNLDFDALIQCFNTIDQIHMEGARW